MILGPSVLQRQRVPSKGARRGDASPPDTSKFQASELATHFCLLSRESSELCAIVKVNRDECGLRPTSWSSQAA